MLTGTLDALLMVGQTAYLQFPSRRLPVSSGGENNINFQRCFKTNHWRVAGLSLCHGKLWNPPLLNVSLMRFRPYPYSRLDSPPIIRLFHTDISHPFTQSLHKSSKNTAGCQIRPVVVQCNFFIVEDKCLTEGKNINYGISIIDDYGFDRLSLLCGVSSF